MIYQDYIKRILDKNKDLKLYKIFADYRPKDTIKEHWYYVLGKNQSYFWLFEKANKRILYC